MFVISYYTYLTLLLINIDNNDVLFQYKLIKVIPQFWPQQKSSKMWFSEIRGGFKASNII